MLGFLFSAPMMPIPARVRMSGPPSPMTFSARLQAHEVSPIAAPTSQRGNGSSRPPGRPRTSRRTGSATRPPADAPPLDTPPPDTPPPDAPPLDAPPPDAPPLDAPPPDAPAAGRPIRRPTRVVAAPPRPRRYARGS